MRRILSLFRSKRREVRESDLGRRYGWLIEQDGECIGELEYACWDESSQFWHEYVVSWRREEGEATRIEDWAQAGIVLRNQKYTDVVVYDFLSAPGRAGGVIAIRNAFVPEEHFRD